MGRPHAHTTAALYKLRECEMDKFNQRKRITSQPTSRVLPFRRCVALDFRAAKNWIPRFTRLESSREAFMTISFHASQLHTGKGKGVNKKKTHTHTPIHTQRRERESTRFI